MHNELSDRGSRHLAILNESHSDRVPIPLIINGRFLTRRITGVERVARGVVSHLALRADADGTIRFGGMAFQPRIFTPNEEALDPPSVIPLLRGRLRGNLWEQTELAKHARDGLLLNLCNTAPIFSKRQSVYVHDAGIFAVADSYRFRFRTWYTFLYAAYRFRGDGLITNSEFSARELWRYAGFSPKKMHVASPGCDHILSLTHANLPADVDNLARGRGYFAVVASQAPHKCIETAIRAHSALLRRYPNGPALVLIGGQRSNVFSGGASPHHGNSTLSLGYVDDALLVSILRHSKGLIFPSRYEGFGLPLAEAMALGCTVIASDLPTLQEIGVDACWTFPPGNISALTHALEAVITRPLEVTSKIEIGRRHATYLSWERCAENVLVALTQSCNNHNRVKA